MRLEGPGGVALIELEMSKGNKTGREGEGHKTRRGEGEDGGGGGE